MNGFKKNFIEIKHTQSGKPMQNGYIERFNRFFREEILEAYYFNDAYQFQRIPNNWIEDCNFNHPQKKIGPRYDKEFKLFIEFSCVLKRERLQKALFFYNEIANILKFKY